MTFYGNKRVGTYLLAYSAPCYMLVTAVAIPSKQIAIPVTLSWIYSTYDREVLSYSRRLLPNARTLWVLHCLDEGPSFLVSQHFLRLARHSHNLVLCSHTSGVDEPLRGLVNLLPPLFVLCGSFESIEARL